VILNVLFGSVIRDTVVQPLASKRWAMVIPVQLRLSMVDGLDVIVFDRLRGKENSNKLKEAVNTLKDEVKKLHCMIKQIKKALLVSVG